VNDTGEVPDAVLREVAAELEDDSFAAQVHRSRYRPASQSESELTTEVLTTLNAMPEVFARKVHGSSEQGAGEPDIDACVRGRAVKIELKVWGGSRRDRPTAKQHRRMLQWQEAGALVGWARDLDEVLAIVDRWDDRTYRWTGEPG